jgi:hypothetical protein
VFAPTYVTRLSPHHKFFFYMLLHWIEKEVARGQGPSSMVDGQDIPSKTVAL